MSSFTLLLVFAATAIIGEGISHLAKDYSGSKAPSASDIIHHHPGLKKIPSEVRLPSAGTLTSAQRGLESEYDNSDVLDTEALDGFQEGSERRHVLLVIAVPSIRRDRRQAIRETWSKWADERVVLRFFTELPEAENGEEVASTSEESRIYGDLIMQDIDRGMNFGLRLLRAMRWMHDRYSFDFFLRLDDDYFLCLERLVDELGCLRMPGKVQTPIYAGYRACRVDKSAYYIDESYILISSALIDRILAISDSDLKCSGYGSLTAGAWFRTGGPGNPNGDVIMVNDYRLDRWGHWWTKTSNRAVDRSEYDRVCEWNTGIHGTYSKHMYKLWMGVSGRTNMSHSRDNACEDMFRYEDDGKCPFAELGVNDKVLDLDNAQPCDSFSPPSSDIYCGGQGC